MNNKRLKAGDWVEVRSKEEILSTLDAQGHLDGMPFMPEMFAFCGRKFQVFKRAHKTCDTVFPIRARRVHSVVHLETRCSGQAHGGCQAACLFFWKEAWLKPVSKNSPTQIAPYPGAGAKAGAGCSEADVWTHVQIADSKNGDPTFVCQATRLPYATTKLEWWDIRQYIEDYFSGNESLWQLFKGLVYSTYYNLSQSGIGLGRPMEWLYDKCHPLFRGSLFPRKLGVIPAGQPTPAAMLDLQPGELVRVKSHEEILRTVNTESKNRGLWWDAEMVPYTGGTFRVLKRVTRIIDEKTGKIQEMKNPCIMLDSVVCNGRYSYCRMFCPRSIFPYWREAWLERVEPKACTPASQTSSDEAPIYIESSR